MATTQQKQMEAERLAKEAMWRYGCLNWLDEMFNEGDNMGNRLTGLTVKYTPRGDSDFMVIAKGQTEDGQGVVCFGTGDTAQNALLAMYDRAEKRGLKWREDKPWSPG